MKNIKNLNEKYQELNRKYQEFEWKYQEINFLKTFFL